MSRDRILRTALWCTVALNAIGVAAFAPLVFGRSSVFVPIAAPPFFAAQVAWVIALFCGVYAWLATQREINRPLVVVGGLGKLGFFGLTLAFALAGEIPMRMAINATPDLVCAAIFFWWASGPAAYPA